MADTKISALPASTTPLAGTEVLPIVQSGTTKQVSVANLTAGRAVSAASLALTTSPLPATSGGTGVASYAVGDILYASTTTALSALADVATGNALISGGVGVAPSWGKIGLTTHVSGTLPVTSGGTGATTLASGAVLYGNGNGAVQASTNLTFDGNNLLLAAGYLSLSDANSLGKITAPAITLTGAGGGGTGGQTVNIATSGTFIGFLTIASSQNESATFLITTTVSLLVSQTAGIRFSETAGGANTANIYVSGSNLVLENNIQATRNFYVTFMGRM